MESLALTKLFSSIPSYSIQHLVGPKRSTHSIFTPISNTNNVGRHQHETGKKPSNTIQHPGPLHETGETPVRRLPAETG